MATAIYIYSKQSSPALQGEGRGRLEDNLDEFLAGVGEVTGGGCAINSSAWNIDLELTNDAKLESWIVRLKEFLRKWGVPEDTYLQIFPEDWVEGTEPRRVDVFGNEFWA